MSFGFELGNGRMQKGPDGNYHVGWMSGLLWNDKGLYSQADIGYESSGGGGGGYFSLREGISSQSVLDQMGFGDKFGINKNGEYGIWVGNPFDPRERGYAEERGFEGMEPEVAVGSARKWVLFNDNSQINEGGRLSPSSFLFTPMTKNMYEAGVSELYYVIHIPMFNGIYHRRLDFKNLYVGFPSKTANGKKYSP